MLARLLLAVNDASMEHRLSQLVDETDVIVETANQPELLWETVSRESFDMVVVGRDVIGTPASETVASLRTLPDSPDVVVLCDKEDPVERASLLGAGCM